MSHVYCSRVLFEVLWFHVVFVSCVFVAFRCLSHSVHQGHFLFPASRILGPRGVLPLVSLRALLTVLPLLP